MRGLFLFLVIPLLHLIHVHRSVDLRVVRPMRWIELISVMSSALDLLLQLRDFLQRGVVFVVRFCNVFKCVPETYIAVLVPVKRI